MNEEMANGLNFLIADDHPLFRQALKIVIEKINLASNVYEAKSGEEAIAFLTTRSVDLIFLDYSMPGMNGYDTARTILSKRVEQKIIVLTQYDEMPVIMNFFKIGVRAFLTKNADSKEIAESIEGVLGNNYYYHSRFDAAIARWLSDGLTKSVPSIKFTDRNMQLIVLLSKGKSTQAISEIMGVSVRSIETYRYNLLKSLGVKNTVELLNYVYQNGIV